MTEKLPKWKVRKIRNNPKWNVRSDEKRTGEDHKWEGEIEMKKWTINVFGMKSKGNTAESGRFGKTNVKAKSLSKF